MPSGHFNRHRLPAALALAIALLMVAACGGVPATPSQTVLIATASPSDIAPTYSASAVATPSPAPNLPTPSTATSATPQPGATIAPPVSISLQPVVGGLPKPIGISAAPGDPRLFVIGQAGQIVVVGGGKITGTFLDISKRMSCCGERGLLGLAFHPQYATNGRFFVRYTDPAGDLRISEFRVSANPNKADPSSEKILLTIPHPSYANHNGGRIEFGPDGYLYIGTGDGGSGGDPHNHGQSLDTLLGKLLRIDVDHAAAGKAYGLPSDNPFVGQAGKLGEIYSYGLRNPYSFSFDRATGDLWIGDVGQDRYEEIDRATSASGRGNGANFGWNVMEANHCYSPSSDCIRDGLTLPLTEYAHGAGDSIGCAVIGGYVYRGTAHPDLTGRYFFGDECSGLVWDVTAAAPASQTPQKLLSSGLNIDGWGQATDGELYVVAANGVLYHLV
jgi:glucose/arabinose dehydrogenase